MPHLETQTCDWWKGVRLHQQWLKDYKDYQAAHNKHNLTDSCSCQVPLL